MSVNMVEMNSSATEPGDVPSEKATEQGTVELHPIPGPDQISTTREILFVFCICLSQILTQACVAQTIPTMSYLARHFNVEHSPGEQSWFSAAFSLTVGTFILISGRLGDIYGYKTMYVSAYIILTVVALVLGFSAYTTSVVFFDVMRGLQGLAFSIAFPNSAALVTHYYPHSTKRTVIMCLYGAVAPTGATFGLLFASVLTVKAWWPWAYWVLSIISAGVAVLGFFVIPKKIGNRTESIKDFDWWGSVTGVAGLILFNFAWNQGPNVGWDKPYVYVLLIVGVLCVAAFFFVEKRAAKPLVPPSALKGSTGFVLVCLAAGWSSFGIWLFYSFRMSLDLDKFSAILSSVQAIPCLVSGLLAAGATAVFLHKIPVSIIMLAAMLSFFVANILMGTRPIGQIYWGQKFFSYAIAPFGMDMSFPAATLVLAHALPRHQQGVAASLVATVVNYSVSIGLGFAGTVELYTTKGLEPSFDTTETGIRNSYYMGAGLAGLGIISAAIFVIVQSSLDRGEKPEKEQETNETTV